MTEYIIHTYFRYFYIDNILKERRMQTYEVELIGRHKRDYRIPLCIIADAIYVVAMCENKRLSRSLGHF